MVHRVSRIVAPNVNSFNIGPLRVVLSQCKPRSRSRQPAVTCPGPTEHFLRQLNHLKWTILNTMSSLVEFRAIDLNSSQNL